MTTLERASELLRRLAGDNASFRPGQREAVMAIVEDHARALVVQRTGWGKSAVYFIATRLLRQAGYGPTILISPLLALMRNQIRMADRLGIKAATINSANTAEWEEVIGHVDADDIDILLISPERFANESFRDTVLPVIAKRCGLLVIDEVHCISDWGHDFRPDYRRVARIIDLLPDGIAVLGTTATANDRVVADVIEQLGGNLTTIRGTLAREGLSLQVVRMPSQAQRLAWLAEVIPKLAGSGIVYCLTIRDAQQVAGWLQSCGVSAVAYSGDSANEDREAIEDDLLANRVKVVCATSALGMGFDKPDLAFVIHYQSPGSPIAYYQQVGRAGRALETSVGVLLSGAEDRDIQDYFIRTAFPAQHIADRVVGLLSDAATPRSIAQIEAEVNIRRGRLEQMLKVLEVEGAVARVGGRFTRTAVAWEYPAERIEAVTAARRAEQDVMSEFATTDQCLMMFLRRQLDDPLPEPCGICMNCGRLQVPQTAGRALALEAGAFLRKRPVTIEPRRQWPPGVAARSGKIGEDVRLQAGRSLSTINDGGWGDHVRRGKHNDGAFSDELVAAAVSLIADWSPGVAWMTFVPSLRQPELVSGFAERLAATVGVPLRPVVRRVLDSPPQDQMENSAQQFRNVTAAFAVEGEVDSGPVLLVDDIHDSRWTLTTVGALLREAGSGPVFPFTLAGTIAT